MTIPFFLKTFILGLLAAGALGPVFIMTFNRAAVCGLRIGLATSIGASFADGFFFFLAMAGILGSLSPNKLVIIAIHLVGGIGLIALGAYILYGEAGHHGERNLCKYGFFTAVTKTCAITMFNPSNLLFFTIASIKLFPDYVGRISIVSSIIGSLSVMAGSMSTLSLVSFIANNLGKKLSKKTLKYFSKISGVAFFGIGLFLLIGFLRNVISLFTY